MEANPRPQARDQRVSHADPRRRAGRDHRSADRTDRIGSAPTRHRAHRARRDAPISVGARDAGGAARAITLTLDDFGTGYSALSGLDRLPIDAVKIDKSFLEPVRAGGDGVIARAIIAMARALGLRVVGEGSRPSCSSSSSSASVAIARRGFCSDRRCRRPTWRACSPPATNPSLRYPVVAATGDKFAQYQVARL